MSQDHPNSVYEALTRSERRQLLDALAITKQNIELHPSGMTERRWIELYHIHLPKLEDAGLINWDTEDHVITKGPRFEEIQPLFASMHENVDRPAEG
ncbi:DUF7344 domain-containing protein [Halosolutus halophilus]|uniref:DUF7344 domain-containing protein n=1 Tax=Halosolutus halophilus TaxID=1552990 RepID=UPI002234F139|nr:hypothetical protein [Halosolutus halophilus]